MNAASLNKCLEDGGAVVVSTETQHTRYTRKHTGWFSQVEDRLYVRHGRGKVYLGRLGALLVGIRAGSAVKS